STQQIFGLQVLLSFVVYALLARWYVVPRLASLPIGQALQPLLALHAFRHLGMVFLVPPVGGGKLPSLVARRARAAIAIPLTWVFNVFGLLDLANAFYQGLSHDVQLGAAYYIPTFIVPALVITHIMIFRLLLRHPLAAGGHLPAPSHM